jgi:hypothetical protein
VVRIELRNRTCVQVVSHVHRRGDRACAPVSARASRVAGVEDHNLPQKGFPMNHRDLTVPSDIWAIMVRPTTSGTHSAQREGGCRTEQIALPEVTNSQAQAEAVGTDRSEVLRTHTTREGGEPQGSRKGRPRYPLEGRGKQMDTAVA